jgi:hypothetical protein
MKVDALQIIAETENGETIPRTLDSGGLREGAGLPGPLEAAGRTIVQASAPHNDIGECFDRDHFTVEISPEEALANAQLWAAAPELLKELEDAHQDFLGLACYLETCAHDVILDNLPSTIAMLKRKQEAFATAIRKAKNEV